MPNLYIYIFVQQDKQSVTQRKTERQGLSECRFVSLFPNQNENISISFRDWINILTISTDICKRN